MNIYSKINPTQILHIINRVRDIQHGRVDLVEPTEFLQCAALRMSRGATFRPHRHIEREQYSDEYIPQESWVVIKGLVKVTLYDLDDTILHEDILEPGDITLTLAGGHNYLFMGEESIVYEFKTGPYLGQEMDKTFI